jgi:serine/threonine-protein kinase
LSKNDANIKRKTMKDLSNSYLGQYYLTEVIGRGSTSVVYKAYQSSLGRYVAVKVLLHHLDKQYAARFIREAHAIAQLQHPNILPIYDYGEQQDLRYLVMQYVESGTTLDDRLDGQPLAPIAALRLMLPLLAALQYAHAHGVVHRDIKPANIMLPQPDWPMLADFGIAKLIDESDQLTPPGQSVGTAIYMAPERASSTVVDARTDLYSVGVVLYEMLTGRVPYDGMSPVEVLRKHVREPLPRPRDLNPRLPAAAEPVLLRALAKQLEDRYQSAGAMAKDLQRLIGKIERLEAQQQLNQLLQQPIQPALPGQLNPYETREFTTDALPIVQHSRAAPPVPPPNISAMQPHSSLKPSHSAAQRRAWLRGALAGTALLAALGGVLLARGAFDGSAGAAPTAGLASATAAVVVIALPTLPAAPPTALPKATPPPLPTMIPTSSEAELPVATATPPAPTEPPAPIEPPAPPTPLPLPATVATTPQISQAGDTVTLTFEDTDWQGGFRRPGGQTYGGRTATWIYGSSTEYSVMRARFHLSDTFVGTVTLTIEGMDSEGRTKTPIQIAVNSVEIYNGPNPLPDDDQPLETGTWASQSWMFDATLLHAGQNEISIGNLAEGAFSRPPFFMLDNAKLSGSTPSS